MTQTDVPYPVTFSVDYPDRELNRLTTFFRLFTVIPIAIVLAFVSGGGGWGGRRVSGFALPTKRRKCG